MTLQREMVGVDAVFSYSLGTVTVITVGAAVNLKMSDSAGAGIQTAVKHAGPGNQTGDTVFQWVRGIVSGQYTADYSTLQDVTATTPTGTSRIVTVGSTLVKFSGSGGAPDTIVIPAQASWSAGFHDKNLAEGS